MHYIFSMVCSFFINLATGEWIGGADAYVKWLVASMCVDYISGIILCLIFRKSDKTETGGYSSKVGFTGLCRKALIILAVYVTYLLENASGLKGLRDIVIMGFAINEMISIIENLGLMGVSIPSPLLRAIDVLKGKEESYLKEGEENDEGKS